MSATPLFKGATRPPTLLGVPMVPLLVTSSSIVLIAFWIWKPFLVALPISIWIMREKTNKDDQFFSQLHSYWQFNWKSNPNRRVWQAGIVSISPSLNKEPVVIVPKRSKAKE